MCFGNSSVLSVLSCERVGLHFSTANFGRAKAWGEPLKEGERSSPFSSSLSLLVSAFPSSPTAVLGRQQGTRPLPSPPLCISPCRISHRCAFSTSPVVARRLNQQSPEASSVHLLVYISCFLHLIAPKMLHEGVKFSWWVPPLSQCCRSDRPSGRATES